jgi:hypothetical protein
MRWTSTGVSAPKSRSTWHVPSSIDRYHATITGRWAKEPLGMTSRGSSGPNAASQVCWLSMAPGPGLPGYTWGPTTGWCTKCRPAATSSWMANSLSTSWGYASTSRPVLFRTVRRKVSQPAGSVCRLCKECFQTLRSNTQKSCSRLYSLSSESMRAVIVRTTVCIPSMTLVAFAFTSGLHRCSTLLP